MIRDSYRVEHPKATVLHDNTISFQGNQYSVPPGYVAKSMTLRVIDKILHIYDNTKLVTVHVLSRKKQTICHLIMLHNYRKRFRIYQLTR